MAAAPKEFLAQWEGHWYFWPWPKERRMISIRSSPPSYKDTDIISFSSLPLGITVNHCWQEDFFSWGSINNRVPWDCLCLTVFITAVTLSVPELVGVCLFLLWSHGENKITYHPAASVGLFFSPEHKGKVCMAL